MRLNNMRIGALTGALLWATGAAAGPTDAEKCEASKLKEAGKFGVCRLKAESKGVKKGEMPDFSKCDTKYSLKWQKAEDKAGLGVCPSEGDETTIKAFITQHTDDIATALAGGSLPTCGDNEAGSGEQCDGIDLDGASCEALGFVGGTLGCDGSCVYDTSGCTGGFPASGQTTAYGAGSDGDVQAGAPLSYTDNGDGTITDNNTGLMWEKKDDSGGGIHDKDNIYTWCGASCGGTYEMDGTITTTFLAALNGGGGFAGYTDWRIPNYKELMSILDLEAVSPAVDPAFHQSATCTGCADVTLASCSCTRSYVHWSSTNYQSSPIFAWHVEFNEGDTHFTGKTSSVSVRAVRGGS